jgi:ParB family transcriptional regulator, chromosome partitioning protein
MAKPPSLGSRFSTSIGAAQQSVTLSKQEIEAAPQQAVSPSKIVPSIFQPRRYFDPTKLQELQESIKSLGILEPLVVRKLGDDNDQYELIGGERRWRCAKNLKLQSVPVVVLDLSDEEAFLAALHDNSQREDLNPIDETEYVLKLLGHWMKLEIEEVKSLLYRIRNQKTRNLEALPGDKILAETAAKIIGQVKKGLNPISFVETRLRLLNLPEDILDCIRGGKIEYTKAKLIAKVKDPDDREEVLAKAIKEKWSIRDVKDYIRSEKEEPSEDTPIALISNTLKNLKASKAWEDPSKWKRIQTLLSKIDQELD